MMGFSEIDLAHWPRREHYQYYSEQIRTSYQMNIELDVTKLRKRCRKKHIRFYPAMIYAIMRAVNANEAFRMAVRDGKLGYYDICHPSYTIFHEDDCTFSDIWTEYQEDFDSFHRAILADMEAYRDVKGIKAKPGRPDAFIPISCVPWISFTGIGHDTTGPGTMYFPVITFGKYTKSEKRWSLPFSILVNHAAADGYHTAKLLNELQQICDDCKHWMK